MSDMLAAHVVVRAIGWAILHSLWQGALLGVLTALVLRPLRGGSASLRYAVACLALAALTMSWTITAVTYATDLRPGASLPGDVVDVGRLAPDTSEVATIPSPLAAPVLADVPTSNPLERWRPRLESWSVAVVPLWFLGICALSIRLAAAWLLVARLRRAATQPIPDVWRERVYGMASRLGIHRPVRVAQSAVVQVPTLIGWLRPVILLPVSVFTGLTVGQLEAVIAHELAHVRRHDYAVNIVQTAVEILLFYHPASWWISRQIRLEREHCCDDVAVTLGGNRVAYAAALADLEALRSDTPGMALAATDGPLMRRIRRLVAPASAPSSWSAVWAAATMPLAVVTLVFMSTAVTGTRGPEADPGQGPVPSASRTIPSTEGVLQGHVLDVRSGGPVPSATVDVLGAQRTATVSTDDEGRFEASALAPGEYRIQARARGYAPRYYGPRAIGEPASAVAVQGGRFTTVEVRLPSAGAISGRVFDDRGEGVAGVEVELVAKRGVPGGPAFMGVGFAQTEALGVFRIDEVLPGDYYVRAYMSGRMPPASRDSLHEIVARDRQLLFGEAAYGVTFYPNVPSIDVAQTLHVSGGQELFDVNLTLVPSRTHRVAGTVIDPTGRAVGHTQVHLTSFGVSSTQAQYTAAVDADGRFEIRGVLPGGYMLLVRYPSPTAGSTSRWVAASREITVDDDLVGLELRARLGARVEGRIERDPGAIGRFDPSGVHVRFERRLRGQVSGLGSPIQISGGVRIAADGTFSVESPGGPSSIQVIDLPAQWLVKAIRLDGVEIGDQPIDFGEGGRRRLEIVLTDRVGRVSGTVADRRGRAVSNASVVVFPDDPTRWGAPSRQVRETRSQPGGRFLLEGLPPGDYLAVALEVLPFNAWFDPAVLEGLRPTGTRVRLGEGEQRLVSLRLSSPPPALVTQAGNTVAEATPSFRAQWSGVASSGSVRSGGTVIFTDDLRDVKSLSDGGFLSIESQAVLSSRRVEIRASNGTLTRKYYVDGTEHPWTDEARRWLADDLPFLVRRSGVAAQERVRQLVVTQGVDGALNEIRLLYTDSVRGRYFRALFDAGRLDAADMNAALTLAGNVISSSHELGETLRSALAAGVQEGDGFFTAVGRISSSVEKRRVLMALLDQPRLSMAVQLSVLAAAARIESNAECATVLDAFATRYSVGDQAIRDAFLAALSTVDSGSERARVLTKLGTNAR